MMYRLSIVKALSDRRRADHTERAEAFGSSARNDGWDVVDLAALVGAEEGNYGGGNYGLVRAAIGEAGVVAVVAHWEDEPTRYQLLVSRDGTTWSAQPVEELID